MKKPAAPPTTACRARRCELPLDAMTAVKHSRNSDVVFKTTQTAPTCLYAMKPLIDWTTAPTEKVLGAASHSERKRFSF